MSYTMMSGGGSVKLGASGALVNNATGPVSGMSGGASTKVDSLQRESTLKPGGENLKLLAQHDPYMGKEPAAYDKRVVKTAEQAQDMQTSSPQPPVPIANPPPIAIAVPSPPSDFSSIWTGIGYSLCFLCIILCLSFLALLNWFNIKI